MMKVGHQCAGCDSMMLVGLDGLDEARGRGGVAAIRLANIGSKIKRD